MCVGYLLLLTHPRHHRSHCCSSFLVDARHDTLCKKNIELFTSFHAIQSYASLDDIYIVDAACIRSYLVANLGTFLKLHATTGTVSAAIHSASLVVLHISCGTIAGFALIEHKSSATSQTNTFHIMLHANLNGKLLDVCRAWARVCATCAWAIDDASWHESSDISLTMNPKRPYHSCMFKPSSPEKPTEKPTRRCLG